MSRESTSIRALQIIRDQLRQIGGKKPTAKFSASLGPYRATEHVFEYINQVGNHNDILSKSHISSNAFLDFINFFRFLQKRQVYVKTF